MRRSYLSIIGMASLALAYPAAAQTPHSSDADRLKAVLAAAADHFKNLRDAPSNSTAEGVKRWEGTVSLGGGPPCIVSDRDKSGEYAVECALYSGSVRSQAEAAFARGTNIANAATDGSWHGEKFSSASLGQLRYTLTRPGLPNIDVIWVTDRGSDHQDVLVVVSSK